MGPMVGTGLSYAGTQETHYRERLIIIPRLSNNDCLVLSQLEPTTQSSVSGDQLMRLNDCLSFSRFACCTLNLQVKNVFAQRKMQKSIVIDAFNSDRSVCDTEQFRKLEPKLHQTFFYCSSRSDCLIMFSGMLHFVFHCH